ncbi:MAG: leucyl/phenylalanyl-tRNA--protein transferase [Cyanobacteria bacterium P01_G01_bin.54]
MSNGDGSAVHPLQVPQIIEGYSQGYFLMADAEGGLGWYTSQERALIPLDGRFRYPKSLRRVLNQAQFTVTVDRAFMDVCKGCADRQTTWISGELMQIYQQLHQAGWAHSFEAWQGDRLAGGILGLAIRGAFIGESMFFNVPNGSKVAMVKLVEHLRSRRFCLFDAQLQNPHLERFGAYVVSDRTYQIQLQAALTRPCRFV